MARTDIQQALDRFRVGTDADAAQRRREVSALRFQVPALAWPDDVKEQRKPQIVGGVALPQRPMLSIPSLDAPIQLTLNAERAAKLGIHIHPISETADDETAEVIQGLYRRIEVDSRASLARTWAFERAVKCGRGYYRVLTEPDPDAGSPFDQKITIKRILQQASVVLDPFAQEPDGSDGQWAFLVQDMPWDTYIRKYPDSEMAAFDADEFSLVGVQTPAAARGGWRNTSGSNMRPGGASCSMTGAMRLTTRFPTGGRRARGTGRGRWRSRSRRSGGPRSTRWKSWPRRKRSTGATFRLFRLSAGS